MSELNATHGYPEPSRSLMPFDVLGVCDDVPSVLLGYQCRLLQTTAVAPVTFCEKSRRVGMTWAIGADAVLTAAASRVAGGMDVYYIGYSLDMTREFIDTCASWARSFSEAAEDLEEFIFKDSYRNERGELVTEEIQAFRIKFDSGYEISALTSRPRSLRGKQGYIIIDEAAFHDNLKELMKAALAMLIWGGKVLVISTHDGVANAFNEYLIDIRGGRYKNYRIVKADLDEALTDGLYERICLTTGKPYSMEAEKEWREELINSYGEGADEELFCIPRQSNGTYLPAALIESRMDPDIPVLRLQYPDEFVHRPEHERVETVNAWLNENVKPLLDSLDAKFMSFIGGDIARSGDLSVFFPMQITQAMVRRPPFVLELRNVPFAQQRQILWFIIDRLPRFGAGAIDARGNGQQMAEETMQRYGVGRIFQVMSSKAWYLDAFPKYKTGLEDKLILLPRDADVANDHRAVVMTNGVPQVSDTRTKGKDKGQRHGDSAIAGALANWASIQNVSEYGYETAADSRSGDSAADDDDNDARTSRGFGKGSY